MLFDLGPLHGWVTPSVPGSNVLLSVIILAMVNINKLIPFLRLCLSRRLLLVTLDALCFFSCLLLLSCCVITTFTSPEPETIRLWLLGTRGAIVSAVRRAATSAACHPSHGLCEVFRQTAGVPVRGVWRVALAEEVEEARATLVQLLDLVSKVRIVCVFLTLLPLLRRWRLRVVLVVPLCMLDFVLYGLEVVLEDELHVLSSLWPVSRWQVAAIAGTTVASSLSYSYSLGLSILPPSPLSSLCSLVARLVPMPSRSVAAAAVSSLAAVLLCLWSGFDIPTLILVVLTLCVGLPLLVCLSSLTSYVHSFIRCMRTMLHPTVTTSDTTHHDPLRAVAKRQPTPLSRLQTLAPVTTHTGSLPVITEPCVVRCVAPSPANA